MRIYRHGDVLFQEVQKIELVYNTQTSEDEKKGIIQRGESTGHAHVIEDMTGVGIFSNWRDRFLKAEQAFTILHEEHKSLTLPAGNYRIRIPRGFAYLKRAARMVVD